MRSRSLFATIWATLVWFERAAGLREESRLAEFDLLDPAPKLLQLDAPGRPSPMPCPLAAIPHP